MRSERDVNQTIEQYADTVKRICALHLKNASDTEDIFQEVFLKYALYAAEFESEEHKKAWLIRVTINRCKDFFKDYFRRNTVSMEELSSLAAEETEDFSELREAVFSLPPKYKDAVYLHYYEGYSAAEIGNMLGKNPNTIYTLLSRARMLLKEKLGGSENE